MPLVSIGIPQTTVLPITPTVFGPVTTHTSLTSVSISIDRTIIGGLNSLDSSTTFTMLTELSFDSGATWQEYSSSTTTGGILLNDDGSTETAQIDNFTFNPTIPKKTQGRLTITVTGSPVVVIGTVAVTD